MRPPTPDFRVAEAERLTAGKRGLMQLPPGVVNPLFLHELALELKMPVGEMCQRMSAHELCVLWPAFFAYRDRERERQQARAEGTSRSRTFG